MSVFKCECCNEKWDTNEVGSLIPSKCPTGYWELLYGAQDNCPSCEYEEGTGRWGWIEE